MTSWLPGKGSSLGDGEELASAPPFEGEIVKPSAQATPYPTTSTPSGYVVPEAGEGSPPALVTTTQPPTDAAAAAGTRTPPVTYGMKPAEVAEMSGPPAAAGAFSAQATSQPTGDVIAAQEGPYAPLAQSEAVGATLQPARATPPADTVAAGFSAAGGTSAGAYPPEQSVGLAPAASETASMPAASPPSAVAAAGTTVQQGAGMQPASAFAAPPAASSFAAANPAGGPSGAAFGQPAAGPPTGSAFSQRSAVPQGSTAESAVAGSRYAAAPGSRFGGTFSPPSGQAEGAAGFSQQPADQAESAPTFRDQAPTGAPWQATEEPAGNQSPQMSAWSNSDAAPPAAATAANAADVQDGGEVFGDPGGVSRFGQTAPETSPPAAAQQSPGDGARPRRRPDPMYRPAGTSSYQISEPIFSDEPTSQSPVQMATFEEPLAEPTQRD